MSLSFKIFQGTPRSGESLCKTCSHSRVTNGSNFEEQIICGPWTNRPVVIDFVVERCNFYYQKGLPSVQDMEKIAWEITTETRHIAGFAAGAEADSEERVVTIKKPEKQPTIIERTITR